MSGVTAGTEESKAEEYRNARSVVTRLVWVIKVLKGGEALWLGEECSIWEEPRYRALRWECTRCVRGQLCGCNRMNKGENSQSWDQRGNGGSVENGQSVNKFLLPSLATWVSSSEVKLVLAPASRSLNSAHWLDRPMLSPEWKEKTLAVRTESFHRSPIPGASKEMKSDACYLWIVWEELEGEAVSHSTITC